MGSRDSKSYMSDLRGEGETKKEKLSISDREIEMEHRRLVMYLSVAGVMAFVVALWVMVLPVQLGRIDKNGVKSVFAESGEIGEAKPTLMEEWRASVESVQRAVTNLSDGLEIEESAASAAGVDADSSEGLGAESGLKLDLEGIREKLDVEPEVSSAETGE